MAARNRRARAASGEGPASASVPSGVQEECFQTFSSHPALHRRGPSVCHNRARASASSAHRSREETEEMHARLGVRHADTTRQCSCRFHEPQAPLCWLGRITDAETTRGIRDIQMDLKIFSVKTARDFQRSKPSSCWSPPQCFVNADGWDDTARRDPPGGRPGDSRRPTRNALKH
jgi:hypothetical protein